MLVIESQPAGPANVYLVIHWKRAAVRGRQCARCYRLGIYEVCQTVRDNPSELTPWEPRCAEHA